MATAGGTGHGSRLGLVGSFGAPDRITNAPGVTEHVVEAGALAVARTVHAPGWRWSTHIREHVGTERCQVRHVGVVVSGRLALELPDGSVLEVGPDDVIDVPPGHDAWTVGDAPVVVIGWTGVTEWLVPAEGERVLASLLFTDIVDSTLHAERLGDRGWRALLSAHDDAVRELLSAGHGRELAATGDGFLALFDGPARAIRTALAIRSRVGDLGLALRQGVHVGEVELSGRDVRGLAVHEAARVMAVADPGEIVVSAVTRTLAAGSTHNFTSRGLHRLKGLPGEHELFAVEER